MPAKPKSAPKRLLIVDDHPMMRQGLGQLIDAEDPRAVLSDDTRVDLLRERGFDLARRTVAKYREAIGLGSSVQRRRQKALNETLAQNSRKGEF